ERVSYPPIDSVRLAETAWKAILQKEMPDRASLAIRHLVGVSNQTKAELCVTVVFSELWFLSIPNSLRHVPLDDQLIHPKDLAVDLPSTLTSKVLWHFSLERR